jgi:hypothetical protein
MDSSKYKHGLGLLPGSAVALALAGSCGGSDGSPGATGGSVSICGLLRIQGTISVFFLTLTSGLPSLCFDVFTSLQMLGLVCPYIYADAEVRLGVPVRLRQSPAAFPRVRAGTGPP